MFSSPLQPAKEYITRQGIWFLGVYFTLVGFLLIQNIYSVWPSFQNTTVKTYPLHGSTDIGSIHSRLRALSDALPVAPGGPSVKDSINFMQVQIQLDSLIRQTQPLSNELDSIRKDFLTLNAKISRLDHYQFKFFINIGNEVPLAKDTVLLLMVVFLGALGSWFHATSSFLHFTGNRTFVTSWMIWYIMRPLMGSMLALIFYLVLRAGFFPSNTVDSTSINYYSIAAVAGLVGLFTQRASKKLADVFDAIFPTERTDKDPLNMVAPDISAVMPDTIEVGQSDLEITVTGTNFNNNSIVYVGEEKRSVEYVNDTTLKFNLIESDVAKVGMLQLTVRNSTSAVSGPKKLKVIPKPDESLENESRG